MAMKSSWQHKELAFIIFYAFRFYAFVIRRSLQLSHDHYAKFYRLRPGWIDHRLNKIELKVDIYCQKCKTDLLKVATKLSGIDQVSVDEEKGILTVVGTVDPILLTTAIRKKKKYAAVISVGSPKKPETPKLDLKLLPPFCKGCQLVPVSYAPEHSGYCSIL